ncbi:MAG: hypothetical protein ACR2LT_09105 [Pyrinomonadaceae bacterium]
MKSLKLINEKHDEYPLKNTPVTLCFEAEMKRLSAERDEPMGEITAKLAGFCGVSERQIYNYRTGKTEIQPEQIKIFCCQFNSFALGCAWFSTFGIEQDICDEFDLSRFASRTVRNVLQAGDKFLSAFDDGVIDGHELNELELASAQIHRDTNRLVEIARDNYKQRRAA